MSATGSHSAARRRRSAGRSKGQRLPRAGPPGQTRGLAESCLWAALELSFAELGATLSLCQTSQLGAPVWLRLGYEPFTSYARYVVPMSPQPGRARRADARPGRLTRRSRRGPTRSTRSSASLRRSVAEFAQDALSDGPRAPRPRGRRSRARPGGAAPRSGIQGLPGARREYGGLGASATTIAAALQGLGYGCADNGLIFSLGAQMWACETPIVHFGTEEQKRRYLPGLCDGSLIAAHAMSEPGSGSDAFSLSTSARAHGPSGWVLNGSKTYATNAPESDLFVVFATTDRALGFAGLCAFLIERGHPGLEIGRPYSQDGSAHLPPGRAVPLGLRGPGRGAARQRRAPAWRIFNYLDALGAQPHPGRRRGHDAAPARALCQLRPRARAVRPADRRASRPSRIASPSMKLRLETAHLMLYRMAALLEPGKRHRPRRGHDQAASERMPRAARASTPSRSTAAPAT